MLRKCLLAVLLCFVSLYANASCVVHYRYTNEALGRAIRDGDGWSFKNYDAICQKLNAANAELMIDGYATVLGGVAITWAVVRVKDRNVEIISQDYVGHSTYMNSNPSMDIAISNYMPAINDAVDYIEIDQALVGLNEARRHVRKNR